ncbi:MAG: metallophosphoesterase family protein [Acidimicrobiales bacterium]
MAPDDDLCPPPVAGAWRSATAASRARRGPVRVAVLADTHLRAGGRALPDAAWEVVRTADVVLHAGDVVEAHLLDELGSVAPVHAVLGNNDHGLERLLPERLELALGGVRIAMVHDSGARAGRPARLRRWFPEADVVVFGHSHDPVDEAGIDGQRLFNPGSPTQRRRQPRCSMGVLDLDGGAVVGHRIVAI